MDAVYRRRMALTAPLSAVCLTLVFLLTPQEYLIAPRRVALSGPLRIYPEIDILPEVIDDRHLTAAPDRPPPSTFVAVEIDYAIRPEAEPVPRPEPEETRAAPDPVVETSTFDDVQDAAQTTGHPILAETEYELLYQKRPVYPREAVIRGIEGEVVILLLVDSRGRVSRTQVINPNRHPLLEQAAVEAVRRYIFRPYRVGGDPPEPFWVRVPIEFRLIG
jgi:protein TonB